MWVIITALFGGNTYIAWIESGNPMTLTYEYRIDSDKDLFVYRGVELMTGDKIELV